VSDALKRLLILAVAAGVLWWSARRPPAPERPAPRPTPAKPDPPPKAKPRRPWPDCEGAGRAPESEAAVGGHVAPDGTEVQLDFPKELHLRNRGGSDGAGLCVFASCTHAGVWQGDPAFEALFRHMWDKPGGGHPRKLDAVIARLCQVKGLPEPRYVQVEGADVEILKLACRTGRMPAVTYSVSPTGRYGGRRVAHMVNLLHADDRWFAVLDNNFPGSVEWMSPADFRRTYTGAGGGWCVILLDPGPPPVPWN
jgi:hypothetical protein